MDFINLKNLTMLNSTISSFGDIECWDALIQIFILISFLLLGNILRNQITFLKNSLMPSALIGGLLLLLVKLIPGADFFINYNFMEIVTYHGLGIGFVALALKQAKKTNKNYSKTVLGSGLLTGAGYIIQAIAGLIITISLFYICGFFPGSGVLLCLGFGQGTGQALNYGKLFESDYGFTGGATFGLTIATIGFIVSSVVGVLYMNILKRKGKLNLTRNKETLAPRLNDFVSENEIPNTESIDKLSVTISIILIIYALVYLLMSLLNINLIWGFNFLLGTVFAYLFKLLCKLFKKQKWMKREYTNNYLLDRISGYMFDLMIIAGVAAIDLHELSTFWWQILLICAAGTVVTFILVKQASKRLYEGYEYEGFFAMFGMLTGTASNGIILLRELDPRYETPAATVLVMQSLPAIAFGGWLLVLLGFIPEGITQTWIALGILVVVFVIYLVLLFKTKLFKNKEKE